MDTSERPALFASRIKPSRSWHLRRYSVSFARIAISAAGCGGGVIQVGEPGPQM